MYRFLKNNSDIMNLYRSFQPPHGSRFFVAACILYQKRSVANDISSPDDIFPAVSNEIQSGTADAEAGTGGKNGWLSEEPVFQKSTGSFPGDQIKGIALFVIDDAAVGASYDGRILEDADIQTDITADPVVSEAKAPVSSSLRTICADQPACSVAVEAKRAFRVNRAGPSRVSRFSCGNPVGIVIEDRRIRLFLMMGDSK